jgi:hypothetical protein
MISPELLRRYPFFAEVSHEYLVELAKLTSEINADSGEYFFHEGDRVDKMYLVVEGAVSILFEVPDQDVEIPVSDQLMGDMPTREVAISAVGPGNPFGWAGLIPPHEAFASAKAIAPSKVITFDCINNIKAFTSSGIYYIMVRCRYFQARDSQVWKIVGKRNPTLTGISGLPNSGGIKTPRLPVKPVKILVPYGREIDFVDVYIYSFNTLMK